MEIFNHTDVAEYIHRHGFEVSAELDGSEEENSLSVPAHGYLRYQITPNLSGSRYMHSHAMAMDDLSRGAYSGQFAFVYVEPERNPANMIKRSFYPRMSGNRSLRKAKTSKISLVKLWRKTARRIGGPSVVEVGYGIRSINGKALGHGEPIRVRERQRVLFHILNASPTENIQLYLPGHEFVAVALDGNSRPCFASFSKGCRD